MADKGYRSEPRKYEEYNVHFSIERLLNEIANQNLEIIAELEAIRKDI